MFCGGLVKSASHKIEEFPGVGATSEIVLSGRI